MAPSKGLGSRCPCPSGQTGGTVGAPGCPAPCPDCPLTLRRHQHLRGLQGVPSALRGHCPHAEGVLPALLHLRVGEGGAARGGLAHLQPRAAAGLPPLHHVALHCPAPVVPRGPPLQTDARALAILHLQGPLRGLRLVWEPPGEQRGGVGGAALEALEGSLVCTPTHPPREVAGVDTCSALQPYLAGTRLGHHPAQQLPGSGVSPHSPSLLHTASSPPV